MPASAEGSPGSTFGRVAGAYARTRPEYARAAIDFAAGRLGVGESATVLDLAAGTGKLTRALRQRFAHVVAVEPDAGMRALAEGETLAGSAEAIPLGDASVDAVFVGEAFHWFDPEPALAEIRRVLRPGGGLAVLARGWGDIPPALKVDLDEVWARFHPPGVPVRPDDWRDTLRPEGPERFTETIRLSGRDLVDLWLTGSTPASISADERAAIAGRAYPLLEGEHELEVTTDVYWKRL